MNTGIDLDEVKVQHNEFGLWLSWTLATAIGMLLGFLPSILLVNYLDIQWARIIVPLLAGFLIGLSQWAVLRNYLTNSADWILGAGTSWAVGFAVGLFLINMLASSVVGTFIGYILFGVIIAIVQWPLLRREIPHIWMWILANVIGWTAGFYVSEVALNLFFKGPTISPVTSTSFISVVTGLVAGAITGIALVFIVRKPDQALTAVRREMR